MDHHQVGLAANWRDRRDVADEIEIELVIECRADRMPDCDEEEGITVRRRTHDRFGGNIAAGPCPVRNDGWLPKPFRHPLAHQARNDIQRTTSRSANDPAYRPRRIGLRPSEAR